MSSRTEKRSRVLVIEGFAQILALYNVGVGKLGAVDVSH